MLLLLCAVGACAGASIGWAVARREYSGWRACTLIIALATIAWPVTVVAFVIDATVMWLEAP